MLSLTHGLNLGACCQLLLEVVVGREGGTVEINAMERESRVDVRESSYRRGRVV